ncbi:MAG: twin-arginine translocase TatA/TatE family subunit [Coriobacteriales bacterium]|nr:twin-arginine translocase TatA/TatE family subunit [Coriobacteriales bacterium]
MLGISGTELVLILFFGFLIFGPEKLPQMGRTIGRAIRQFRTASDSMNQKFKDEVADPFKDAVSPYTDDIKDVAAPIKDDIDAINKNLRDVQNTVTNPIKSVFSAQQDEHSDMATRKTAAVIAGSATSSASATQSAQPATTTEAPGDDPFASVFASEKTSTEGEQEDAAQDKPKAQPLPDNGGTVKKSMAASLYDLDSEDGE